jgi:hypothetical protein
MVLVGTAYEISRAIDGMALADVEVGIRELTEILTMLYTISEIVPVNKRGYYLAIATGLIIPLSL